MSMKRTGQHVYKGGSRGSDKYIQTFDVPPCTKGTTITGPDDNLAQFGLLPFLLYELKRLDAESRRTSIRDLDFGPY